LAMDKDKTGTITFNNMRTAINAQFDLSEKELKEIFDVMNLAHDEEIHYSEFIAAVMQTRVHMDKNLLRETFDHLDVFHAGKITKKDLQKVIGGNKFEHTDINSIMYEIEGCTPKSGISFEKFSEHLQHIDSIQPSDSIMKACSPNRCRNGLVPSPPSMPSSTHGSFASITSEPGSESEDSVATPKGGAVDGGLHSFGELSQKTPSRPQTPSGCGEKGCSKKLATQLESDEEQDAVSCTSEAVESPITVPLAGPELATLSCGLETVVTRSRSTSIEVHNMVSL